MVRKSLLERLELLKIKSVQARSDDIGMVLTLDVLANENMLSLQFYGEAQIQKFLQDLSDGQWYNFKLWQEYFQFTWTIKFSVQDSCGSNPPIVASIQNENPVHLENVQFEFKSCSDPANVTIEHFTYNTADPGPCPPDIWSDQGFR